jgi:hypothetical protein
MLTARQIKQTRTSTMTTNVLFSIDKQDQASLDLFKATINYNRIRGGIVSVEGMYHGRSERSFVMSLKDFNEIVRGTDAIHDQESILLVSGSRMESTIEYLDGPVKSEYKGRLKEVSKATALDNGSYTYRQDLNAYWISLPHRRWK